MHLGDLPYFCKVNPVFFKMSKILYCNRILFLELIFYF